MWQQLRNVIGFIRVNTKLLKEIAETVFVSKIPHERISNLLFILNPVESRSGLGT